MNLTFEDWPFRGIEQRSHELNQRWWQTCHVPGEIDGILQQPPQWRVIHGTAGSGRSTALAALRRRAEGKALIVEYPSLYWRGSRHAPRPDGNHLSQMMARAAFVLSQDLAKNPHKLTGLSQFSLEFLRWLIEKFSGARAYQRWLALLPAEARTALEDISYINLFPTDTELDDVAGQIVELVMLCRLLGYEQVLFLVDVEDTLNESQIKSLHELSSWFEIMHHEGFNLVAAMPRTIFEKAQVEGASDDRITLHGVYWKYETLHAMTLRYVQAASNGKIREWRQLCQHALEKRLMNLLATEISETTPSAAVALARVLMAQSAKESLPLRVESFDKIRRAFYGLALPLRLDLNDPNRRVWRGQNFIYLDQKPFAILKVLWKRRGEPVQTEDRELLEVAYTPGNVYVLIDRLRDELEPVPSDPIYVRNERGTGYWLENLILEDKTV